MDLLYNFVVVFVLALVAFLGGKGFKWNTQRKTRKEVFSEINQASVDQYMAKKAEFDAREPIHTVDAAREFLHERSGREP